MGWTNKRKAGKTFLRRLEPNEADGIRRRLVGYWPSKSLLLIRRETLSYHREAIITTPSRKLYLFLCFCGPIAVGLRPLGRRECHIL